MKLFSLSTAIALIMVLAFTGCKKDEESPVETPNNTTPTAYVGTIASANQSGSISLTVAPSVSEASLVLVTGSLRLFGTTDTIALEGTLNGDTLAVVGGGYTFNGLRSGNNITGTYSGPGGDGSFMVNPSSSSGSVRVFCGSYTEDTPGTDHGTFNMVINANNTINVIAVDAVKSESTPFEGTLTGTTISVYLPGTPSAVIATGTLSGTAVSGTYTGTSTGDWEGTQF